MTLVFTICSNNYLALAISLGQSLLKHNPGYVFKIGLVDKRSSSIDYEQFPFEIVEVEKIGVSEFDNMFKRYSITELNTAVKPQYFNYFIKNNSTIRNFIYLDPDILVYKPFHELEEELKSSEIIITPHITKPIDDNMQQAENNFLNAGLYNLGFIALRRGKESAKLLDWWAKRLETKAYVDFANGLFTDQLWINFVPLFFESVHIFRHPGYNMAYWNLHERQLSPSNEVMAVNTLYPLVFFHFSGYSPLKAGILSKYQDRFSFENRTDVARLFADYASRLLENKYETYTRIPCTYMVEKQKIEAAAYAAHKKSIPLVKRVIRGCVLRFIKLFNIDVSYYTQP